MYATVGLLTGLLLAAVASSQTQAAVETPAESITLSPVSKQYTLKAGEVKTDELTVINDGAVAYDFTVYAQPYSVTDEGYEPDFTTSRPNTDLRSWIQTEKKSYRLQAGESVRVVYTITVPKNAAPGGHFGVIFAETQPLTKPVGNSVERKKRVGAIIYATVEGQFRTGGALRDVSIPGFQLKTPLVTQTRVENTGNASFGADLTLQVTDLFGQVKHKSTKSYQVLPETTRKIPMDWAQAPSFGLFKTTVTAKFLDQQVTRSGYVLMAPLGAYLAAVIALFAAIIYVVQKRR